MIRYTTPTISLVVEGVDISAHEIFVTLEQGNIELTKTAADLNVSTDTHDQITDTVIQFVLSQEDTAMFKQNMGVAVQVNWLASGGVRAATEIKQIGVLRNLLDEVIA